MDAEIIQYLSTFRTGRGMQERAFEIKRLLFIAISGDIPGAIAAIQKPDRLLAIHGKATNPEPIADHLLTGVSSPANLLAQDQDPKARDHNVIGMLGSIGVNV